MEKRKQAGFTLIEAVLAVAILAVAMTAFTVAMGEFGKFSTSQAGPVRTAAMLLAEQTLRVAEDAWKYGAAGNAPEGSLATRVPLVLPGARATTAPLTVTTALSNADSAFADLVVTVRYTPDPDHLQDTGIVTLDGELQVKAPLPASTVAPPNLIAQPQGAP